MKIQVTFEANNLLRLAVSHANGQGTQKATRAELEAFFGQHGLSTVGETLEKFHTHLLEQLQDGKDEYVAEALAEPAAVEGGSDD